MLDKRRARHLSHDNIDFIMVAVARAADLR